jgi:UDP-N-acetylmuramoyl-tripeptide--D-alanyl-D-alanine ligase
VRSALAAVGLAACVVAAVPAGLRWVRVAQREHYLAGAATRFAWRWWTSSPVEVAAALVGLAAAIVGAVVPATVLASAAIVAFGPRGLGVRGRTSKLRWTRRCKSVGAALATVLAAAIAISAAAGGLRGAAVGAAVALVLLPLLLDGVLALLRPVEDRLAHRFVARAADRVERVAPQIVAITGSYGKTTTKSYVAHLLAGRFDVVASPRSFNNRAGLARTVNDLLAPGTDVLVAEMGAYGPGEIAALCAWLPPKVAILTAIGPVHLERFKSLDRTVAAKAEITERAAVTVVNADDDRLASLASRLEGEGRRVVRCSAVDPKVEVAVIVARGGLALYRDGVLEGTVEVAEAKRPPALSNAACAVGAAFALGCTPAEILERLASLPVTANRLEVTRSSSGAAVLDDTFNANPAGAALALAALAANSPDGGRRVVVTPGMVELGSAQPAENAAFARAAAQVATDVVVVGRTNRRALTAGVLSARQSGDDVRLRYAATREEAVELVRSELGAVDAVLYENDLPDHFP